MLTFKTQPWLFVDSFCVWLEYCWSAILKQVGLFDSNVLVWIYWNNNLKIQVQVNFFCTGARYPYKKFIKFILHKARCYSKPTSKNSLVLSGQLLQLIVLSSNVARAERAITCLRYRNNHSYSIEIAWKSSASVSSGNITEVRLYFSFFESEKLWPY